MNTLRSLPLSPDVIIEAVLGADQRVLLAGRPGIGKSTLATALAKRLRETGRSCLCIGADPGSPLFGIPGAVCLGRWYENGWALLDIEALCTLDAGRFRLPLVAAAGRLASRLPPGPVLVDGPGVMRGVAGAELLPALVEAVGIDTVLLLMRAGEPTPLGAEVRALPAAVFSVTAAAEAKRPGRHQRTRARTALWEAYLEGATTLAIDIGQLHVVGTPPPVSAADAWTGRQVALLEDGHTRVMGEVLAFEGSTLQMKLPSVPDNAQSLLVRDARRLEDGCLGTAAQFVTETVAYRPVPDVVPPATTAPASGPPIVTRVGLFDVALINGVFGDPLLHLRPRYEQRSLLFDLGEGSRLSARVAHQVSDVFITHTHIDHIAGFLWLLRSRIGDFPACRLYGPPGLAVNIEGLTRGILWDRIADRGPRFEVTELHGTRLLRYRVQAGAPGCENLGEQPVADGIVHSEPAFQVRATQLDHFSPVLAYAIESVQQINMRKDRLQALGLSPGPWLRELKEHVRNGERDASVRLPDGRTEKASTLAADLLFISPGKKLVYATDFADTADNRQRLITLARAAHTLFCEASFREADAGQARRTAHLTTQACGEIAAAAQVARLIPFHFSRRYENDPVSVYEEIAAVCPVVEVPASVAAAVLGQ